MKKRLALSITCTSLAFGTLTVAAQELPLGCFARDYDAAHLAAHPDQVIERLRFHFHEDHSGFTPWFEVRAVMADQGHAAHDGLGGEVMSEVGSCYQPGFCGVDCDGGLLEITSFDGNLLEIRTEHLRLSTAGCGGEEEEGRYSTLAEIPGEATTYRLYAASPSVCSEF